MATNHTTNYALNLWEPTDAFLREEFNENSEKIDAALNALSQTVAQKSRVIVGYYTGDGQASRIINLGVRPRAVFVYPGYRELCKNMSNGMECCGGAAFDGLENSYTPVSIVGSGFRVRCDNSGAIEYHSNITDDIYYYFAFC